MKLRRPRTTRRKCADCGEMFYSDALNQMQCTSCLLKARNDDRKEPLCPKCNKPMNRKTFEAGHICVVCHLQADPDFGDKTDVEEDGIER